MIDFAAERFEANQPWGGIGERQQPKMGPKNLLPGQIRFNGAQLGIDRLPPLHPI
jgi:hypothetical protein